MKAWAGNVAVVVKDAQKSKKWFVEKLGMKVIDDMDHWVTVGQPRRGVPIHLCQMKPLEKGNTGIIVAVDQPMEKAYQELKRKGVKFTCPPTKHEWGYECRFVDLDGNEFWLMPAR